MSAPYARARMPGFEDDGDTRRAGYVECCSPWYARLLARCMRLSRSYRLHAGHFDRLDFRAFSSLDDRCVRVVLVVPEPQLGEEWFFVERLGQGHFEDVVEGRIVL